MGTVSPSIKWETMLHSQDSMDLTETGEEGGKGPLLGILLWIRP